MIGGGRCSGSPISLLCILVLSFLCSYSHGELSNDEKFRQLQRLAHESPVIHFSNADMYHSLVTEADRNYSVFVLFTATAASYKCGQCVATAEELKRTGVSYEAHFGDYHNPEFLAKPFFLGQIEPNDAMDVFSGYQFKTVPHFVYIPAGAKKVTKLRDDHFLRNSQTSVRDIVDFINKKISVEVPIYVPLLERYTPLLLTLMTVALVVRLARKYTEHIYNPMLWYVFALITYMVVMAGVVYNRIRNPPLMDVQQGGRIALISPSPRTQYVAEGVIIAIVMGGLGVVFVALADWVPRVTGAGKKRALFWLSSVILFMLLATLNNIFHVKYHMNAFRLNWRLF